VTSQTTQVLDHLVTFIVINSIPPYAYEINNILALPNGVPYRVRYRKKWLPNITDAKQISRRDGVIVLRNWDTGEFVPLRHINISTVDVVGNIYYINYLLKDLIDFDSDESLRTQQLQSFNAKLAVELNPYPNNPGSDLDKLIFLTPDLTASIQDSRSIDTRGQTDYGAWGKIVGLIGNIQCYIDTDFLKIIQIADINGEPANLIQTRLTRRFMLTGDQTYSLEVFQHSFTSKGRGDSSVSPRNLQLNGETEAVRMIKNEFAISGKYDRYEFRFKTESLNHTRDIDLSLEIHRQDNRGMPTLYIPVRITNPLWVTFARVLALAFFVIGTILLFFADKLFPNSIETARNVGIFAMIISGPDMQAFVLMLLRHLRVGLMNN
jgi:hypothetical protein